MLTKYLIDFDISPHFYNSESDMFHFGDSFRSQKEKIQNSTLKKQRIRVVNYIERN